MNIRSILILIFTIVGNLSFGQERVLVVRISSDNHKITTENMIDLVENQPSLLVGLLEDGTGIIVFDTDKKAWKTDNLEGYKIKTFPTRINYNVLCKIAKDHQTLSATFVQYNTVITKFNVQQVPQLQYSHYNYLKQLKNIGSVLFEGNYDNDDGGILLIEGSIEAEVINADPTIRSGFIIPDIQKAKLTSIKCD